MSVLLSFLFKKGIIFAMFETKLDEVSIAKNTFLRDPLNYISLGVGLVINIIHWLVIYIKIGFDNSTLLLHYNVVYGSDFVERSFYLYLIPLTALLIYVFNFFLARFFNKKEKLASYFLNFSGIAIQLIFFVASIIILSINA
jgi:hypothetical protein